MEEESREVELDDSAHSVIESGDDGCTNENASVRVGLSSLTPAEDSGARTSMCLSAGTLSG